MDGILTALDTIPPLRRVREAHWSLLLVPVTLMVVGVFGKGIPWGVTAVLAAVTTLLIPAVAADLVTVGVICIGHYACYVTAWMVLQVHHPAHASHPAASMIYVRYLYHQAAGVIHVSKLYYPVVSVIPAGHLPQTAASAAHAGPSSSAVTGRFGLNPLSAAFLTGSGAGITLDVLKSVLILGFGGWLWPRTIGVHAGLVQRNAALASRVDRLTEARVTAVEGAAAELRQLERNLHDGAQARLVALGINLRAAEQLFKTNPDAALALVAESRENSALALAELRALVRGIHPPVLADRGLADAIQALALSSPVPAETEIQLPGRLPAPVESAAYFAVAEALANAVKHAGARTVHIRIGYCAGMLRIEVTDDGHGGADAAHGTGLLGVERRVAAFDGILAISSPPGGPTIIVIEVPCALSSPKTSSS